MRNHHVLFTEKAIQERIEELGKEIDDHYDNEEIVVISLLRGSFMFCADLVRQIQTKVVIDFITTSSYSHEKISSGFVEIVHDMREDVKNKRVLIVDDIIDSGRTIKYVKEHTEGYQPKDVKVCTLLDKPSRRQVEMDPDFCGFVIDDVFIVGYGLNYGDHYRNIPYVFTFDATND